jgi:hypothetical protein
MKDEQMMKNSTELAHQATAEAVGFHRANSARLMLSS